MQYTDIFILNVGRGSCTIVAHPSGRKSMIDINNGKELRPWEQQALRAEGKTLRLAALKAMLVNPVDWFSERFPDEDLWRFILSHPDLDHMSGLRCILQREQFGTDFFWDLRHTKRVAQQAEYPNTEAFMDHALYELMRQGESFEDLVWPKVLRRERFDVGEFWTEDGIEVLSPTHAEVAYWDAREDWNNMSYVLRVTHGGRSVMLPGDVEQPGWNALAAAVRNFGADILVASHHGRKTGFPDNGVIDQIAPRAVVISSDPLPADQDATRRYHNATGGNVFSTRHHETIQIRIWDDGEVWLGPETSRDALFTLPPLQRYGLAQR